MGFIHWISPILLATSVARASVLPPDYQEQYAKRASAVGVNTDIAVEVDVSASSTLAELAEELSVDLSCLLAANPLLSLLTPARKWVVPYSCCKTSCAGSFCSKRPQCQGQSTSSAPAQTPGTTTVTVSSITTSVTATTSDINDPSTSISSTSSSPADTSTEFSDTVITPSGTTSTEGLPGGDSTTLDVPPNPTPTDNVSTTSSSTLVDSTEASSVTTASTAVDVVSTTTSPGLIIGTDSAGVVTLPGGVTSASVSTLPDGSIVTLQSVTNTPSTTPVANPGVGTTTDSLGQTVISDSSGAVTLPTGVSSSTIVTLPGGSVVTFQPTPDSTTAAPGPVTTTDSTGATVISDGSGALTLPAGVSSSTLVTLPGGTVVTFQPATTSGAAVGGPITTTDSTGATVISDGSGAVTIPSGLSSTTIVTLPDGGVATFEPAPSASASPGSPGVDGVITTTNAAGETVISDNSGAVTLPVGVSTTSVVTLPDGGVVTFVPPGQEGGSTSTPTQPAVGVVTTVDPAGETVISSAGQGFTIPTGLNTPVTVTNGGGFPITFTPNGGPTTTTSSSSVIPFGGLFPVTTLVSAPKATDGGTQIPCTLWFFFICIRWGEINIDGWEFNLPEGVRPPGPPPPISFPPALSITVSVTGKLPDWPSLTIGPDRLPTFEPKPSNGPDNGCRTESAEVCLTSTSFGVNTASVTTTSSVTSTCATVFGCEVTDSSTSTATTSTSSTSTYPYSCTPGCANCAGKRSLPTRTAAPGLPAGIPIQQSDSLAQIGNLTLDERDIYDRSSADGIAEFYDDVIKLDTSREVTRDTREGLVGISSSRFEFFANKELNIYVEGLNGCTTVVIISQLGAYVTHFWEQSFTEPPGTLPNFQKDILDYFNSGRPGDAGEGKKTEPLAALVKAGVFPSDKYNTKIFIMTPANYNFDMIGTTPRADQTNSLTNGDFQPLFDGSEPLLPINGLGAIRASLSAFMPNVPITQFTYRRQTNELIGAFGRAMILYSNKQEANPDDPLEDLPSPQKAIWQCWMQGKKMGQDIWDALPGQARACDASPNQKRQAGDSCSLSSVSTSSTSTSSSTTTNPTRTTTNDFPTLTSTVQTTPPGQTCVSSTTESRCALGPNPGQTACAASTFCASFAPTSTSTTALATPTTYVTVQIYSDSSCKKQVDRVDLSLNRCYSPDKSFKCFSMVFSSPEANTRTNMVAYKGEGCFSLNEGDRHTYPDLPAILNTQQHPFTMKSLTVYVP